ncbi:BglG family transcription antiterminator [Enterococcus pallens]|uniref:PTS system EIIA component n=1 Tax=Enterococcus pallens ATCC BAA-351 TaxID=1158607 RepID=R2QM53_9ENTE|nr:BglG family transcription antiterminator [Enterococcus pallens]EOH97652.1 hypothetical protein UAU_00320 [Enterococcus pallens ATCC BAA-351]EOU20929.1 hypothetical protein I588_01776 [Enterococcus pallens ATCC BAA-351]OJG80193.1 hypothetical protein RV10_GL004844 [Enterococcus pallens]
MIDNQDLAILHEVTFRNERSLEELEKKFALTRRQLTYAIKKINEILMDNQQTEIRITGSSLSLAREAERYLQKYLLELEVFDDVYHSKENRQLMILLMLSCSLEYISLDHLIVMLESSRSTVLNDLKEVKNQLTENNLKVNYTRAKGYHLLGKEEDIRYMIMKKVITCLHEDNGELFIESFLNKHLKISYLDFERKILKDSQVYDIHFFENKLKEFTYCFVLLNQRFKHYALASDYGNDLFDCKSNEYQFSQSICNYFGIIEEQNISYVTAWILGLSVGDITKQTKDRSMIKKIVQRLVTRFENLAGIRFLNEEAVVKRLYEHVRSSYYRIFYHLPIVNPLTSKIQKEYAEMYCLVNEAIRPLQPLFKRELPADEIAFLTVHFAASTFEEKEEQVKRSRGLVLCPSGIGTSIILLKELESLFPCIEFIAQNLHKKRELSDFDIVFTTTITSDILSIDIPFIVVNPIMTSKEKFELIGRVYDLISDDSLIDPKVRDILKVVKKYVSYEQYEKIESEVLIQSGETNSRIIIEEGGDYPLLSEITNKELVKLGVEASNWEDAIRNSTQVLVENGKVSPGYIDGMIQTTKETGPYIVITKHVALPHARPETGAKEIAISIATLKQPIEFGNAENDPVKYIFGLSALDNQTHLTAMAELAELLDQQEFYEILDNAKKPEEIIDFIKKFESEE